MSLPYFNTNTTINTGTGIIYTSGPSSNSIKLDESLIEYIDLLYQLIDVDMSYDKFKNLSTSEKKSFIRDIKIKKLLDNDLPKNK